MTVSEITPRVLAEGHEHTMALEQAALLEVPDAVRAADVDDRIRSKDRAAHRPTSLRAADHSRPAPHSVEVRGASLITPEVDRVDAECQADVERHRAPMASNRHDGGVTGQGLRADQEIPHPQGCASGRQPGAVMATSPRLGAPCLRATPDDRSSFGPPAAGPGGQRPSRRHVLDRGGARSSIRLGTERGEGPQSTSPRRP